MPAISLVVCVHRQRDLLERLLEKSAGCYDELIVEHDSPDSQNVGAVVAAAGGRFFERAPTSSQEPHWAFLWGQATHDWILRLDADEFPSEEMRVWLTNFRRLPEPPADLSGYTCHWPLWDGQRAASKRWPSGRNFLFHRQRVRFFGMGEEAPHSDGRDEPVDLVLCHQPHRKSYGVRNALKAHPRGRAFIAKSLLGKPTDLNCWRWESEEWPCAWEQIRQQPIWTCFKRFTKGVLRSMRDQWKTDRWIYPNAAVGMPVHHLLLALQYRKFRREEKENKGRT